MTGAQANFHRGTGFATYRFDKIMVYQMIKNKQRNTTKQQYEVQGDCLYRFILFFLLGWVIFTIVSCASAPIDKEVIRHGVIDYHELIEPLGTKHLYKEEPIIGKPHYCIIHKYPEIVYVVDDIKRVRRWSGI